MNQTTFKIASDHQTSFTTYKISMDPELVRTLLLSGNGEKKMFSSSTAANEVAVIARVSSKKEWKQFTEIRNPVIIGNISEHESIVTGRIPIKRIEYVRSLPFVKSLKAARKLKPVLSATVKEIEVNNEFSADILSKGGKGSIIGIVDFGCDFAHKNFLTGGKSRILKIWDQRSLSGSGKLPYGTVYSQKDIEQALTQNDVYNSLGYSPGSASHGTHVMDIAAGNGGGSGVPGVAPEANIIFVEVDSSDIPWTGPDILGRSFGDSVHLLEALRFIFDEAGKSPCVINVSLGTNGGPHDGSSLVEQGIDSLVSERPNRAVVIAAANSFTDNIHAFATIPAQESFDLNWKLSGNQRIENEMEIWYPGLNRLTVELFDETGKSIGEVEPGESGTEENAEHIITMVISNRLDDPNNHDNVIGIYIKGGSGVWRVRLKNSSGDPTPINAWIERNDGAQSSFDPPMPNGITLGSISCGQKSIVVGSYDAHKQSTPLSWFSSSGPTRDGREKPEISAPGHNVRAASSMSVKGVISMSGTSMAAPAVTGALAVYLAEASARGINLTIDDIRNAIKNTARQKPPANSWDNRYGWGRISVKGLISTLVTKAPSNEKTSKVKGASELSKSLKPKTNGKSAITHFGSKGKKLSSSKNGKPGKGNLIPSKNQKKN